jgi:hypothetical protein
VCMCACVLCCRKPEGDGRREGGRGVYAVLIELLALQSCNA